MLADSWLVRSPGVSLVAAVVTRLLMVIHCLPVGPQLPVDPPFPAVTSWRGAGAAHQQKHAQTVKLIVIYALELNTKQKVEASSQRVGMLNHW